MNNKNKFNANSDGYDIDTANRLGYKRSDDPSGHLPSLDYNTGMVLKGRNHPTWNKMVEEEKKLGNNIIFNKNDNRYYSVSDSTPKAWLEEADPLTEFNKEDFLKVGKIYDKLNRSNKDTKIAQEVLNKYGYKLEMDGFYGENTKKAVEQYIGKYSGDYMWNSMKSKIEDIFD